MIDKIPIKTLLDHAKQPFIPYTTAKSVMWDGTDKTLYDVVMEGVPMPEIVTEALPTYELPVTSTSDYVIISELPKGIYSMPFNTSYGCYRLYYKWSTTQTGSATYIDLFNGFFVKHVDADLIDERKMYISWLDSTGKYYTYTSPASSRINNKLVTTNKRSTLTEQLTFNVLPITSVTPTTNEQFTNKAYVDGAITEALASFIPTVDLTNYYTKEEIDTELGERDTALNADIMVAINAAGRAEMEVQNKQSKITYGTGDPSDGSDGDVYLKYTA